jgi:DNA (cytosine-5)-methyltransferase 1
VTGTDRHALVMPMPMLAINYSPGYSKPVTDAAATITGQDHHALVIPQTFFLGYANGEGPAHGISEPLLTLHTENEIGVAFPSEPPAVKDCGFRMLRPPEVKRGMGFPDEYIVLGNGREQVKQCGNAVTPVVPRMLMRPIMETLR